jgi:hypothetical protein
VDAAPLFMAGSRLRSITLRVWLIKRMKWDRAMHQKVVGDSRERGTHRLMEESLRGKKPRTNVPPILRVRSLGGGAREGSKTHGLQIEGDVRPDVHAEA